MTIVERGDGMTGKILRWHVVQNRPANPSDTFDREREEIKTFSKDPWLRLPPDQRGTPMLKTYLANILCQRIRAAFPSSKLFPTTISDLGTKITSSNF